MPAALAAYCAGQQDPKWFWAMHDWIFANQGSWSEAQDAAKQFRDQALAIGVDATKYDACLSAPETAAAIQADLQAGAQMGVSATPAFFINDWFLAGAYPYDEFKATIEKAKQGQHPPPTATPFPTFTPLPEGADPLDPDPARPGITYEGSPTQGSADAPIILLVFEDLKCADCAKHATEVEPALKTKYVDTGQVRLMWKTLAAQAPKAALAARCAAAQGKFPEFRTALFQKQDSWTDGDDAAMLAFAKGIGLDEAKFSQCLKDAPDLAQLDADLSVAQQIGVPSLPAFLFVDAKTGAGVGALLGNVAVDQFDAKFQEILNPPTAAPAPTTAAGTPAPTTAAGTPAPTTAAGTPAPTTAAGTPVPTATP
jgi:protein-disulfide isomerase